MKHTKLRTVLLWIAYIAVCLLSAALPFAERGIKRNLIGKEENDEQFDTTYNWDYSHRRSL